MSEATTSQPSAMAEIPDLDPEPPKPSTDPSKQMASLKLGETTGKLEEDELPDMDDIPDMDDMDEGAGLEEEDSAAVRIVHPSA